MKSIMEEASSIAKAIETAWTRAGQPTEFSVKVLELPQTSFFGLKTSKSAKVAFFFNEATVTVRSKESSPADRHQRNNQQRPVTLRQPGTKPDHDQQRRPHAGPRPDSREASVDRPDYAKASSDRQDNRQPREQREQREPREPRDMRETREPREPREPRENRGFEQRQDRPTRPQDPRRPDYAKATSDRPEGRNDRNRRPEYGKNPSDRNDDRRPRYESERSDQGGYSQERESWTPDMAQIAQEWIKETLVLMGKPDITVNTQVSHNYLKVNLSAPVLDDARQEETQLKSWGMLAMEAVREKAGKPLRSLRIILESNK